MLKIITSFHHSSDAGFAVEAQHIVDSLTGNAHFETPMPPLADVQTTLADYEAVLAQMASGNKETTVIKNQKRTELETLLMQLALYVQLHCNNDPAIALSSGFALVKMPVPSGPLPKPENLKAIPGSPGEIHLSVHAILHAKSYIWQYRQSGGDAWTDAHSTGAKTTVTGLASGQQYIFKVTALGANPAKTWSDEISSYVL